jgi:O-antigen ligase
MNLDQVNNSLTETSSRRLHLLRLLGLAMLFLLGFATMLLVEAAHKIESQGLRFVATVDPARTFCLIMAGVLIALALIRFPEIALALFFLVGLVKGDARLASLPVDLTVSVGVMVVLGIAYRLYIKGQVLELPPEYFFYLPLLAMMSLSLSYTPDFDGGVEKSLRFVCLTSIGIIAPFALFENESKLRRFFLVMALGGLLLAVNSLTMLGGEERMVSPSGLNTELGSASAVALIILWGVFFPRWPLGIRILFYPVIGVLGVALVGSGGRFANVSAVICLAIGTLLCRKLFTDVLIVGGLGLLALPLIWIPQASFDYLRSLAHPSEAMGTRNDLMWLGVRMFSEHPLLGVGVQGFRYLSPNPFTYNYPHNLVLELGSEMGVVAAFAFLALAFCSFREIMWQLNAPLLRRNTLVITAFLLLIYVFLDAMVSGDINDLRFMWFVFGLPFVLRNLESTHGVIGIEEAKVTSVARPTKIPVMVEGGFRDRIS